MILAILVSIQHSPVPTFNLVEYSYFGLAAWFYMLKSSSYCSSLSGHSFHTEFFLARVILRLLKPLFFKLFAH